MNATNVETPMNEALTVVESGQLADLENVIESGIKTFAEVGKALLAIRDARLYRAAHGTFETYCRERWGFARQTAYQYIEAAKVVANVRNCGQIEPPATESQARPLARLAPAEQPEAWKEANERAGQEGRKVTAKDVETVVEERVEQRKERAPDPFDPPVRETTPEPITSACLCGLKRYWRQATKKERKAFLEWANQNEN